MIIDRMERHPGARLLFILACLVVVVYGLKFAVGILLPTALALFLTVLSLPIMFALRRRGVPAFLANGFTVLVVVSVFGLLGLLASQSVPELQTELPRYVDELTDLQREWIRSLEERTEIPVSTYVNADLIDPTEVVNWVGTTVGRIAQLLGSTFIVLLIMIFMLAEATVFPDKFHAVLGRAESEDRLEKVVREIQSYLGIKTVISLATGLLVGAWAFVLDLDFPVLLGLVGFALNYIPTVGSIIAAAPAVLLSLILHGTLTHALLTASGYVVVNMVFGNVLEPNLMGRRLGLSTLVVILSQTNVCRY